MIAIEFPEKNFTFQKPEGMTDEECSSLDVWRGVDAANNPAIISVWKPSLEDLEALNNGGAIYLQIVSNVMPPVALYTEYPFNF